MLPFLLLATLLAPVATLNQGLRWRLRTPAAVPWVAQVDRIDPRRLTDADVALLRDCFKKFPLMVFKRQGRLSAAEFWDFVKKFDEEADQEAIAKPVVLHPFRQEEGAPHVARRESNTQKIKDLSDQFRFGEVWHMDLVGSHKASPNFVSAFQFLEVPRYGGETVFANLENAYDAIEPQLKKEIDELVCVYDNDFKSLLGFEMAMDGFRRLGPFPGEGDEKQQVAQRLVRRDKLGKKRIFFTPNRFSHFEGKSREESWELMSHLFHRYVNVPGNTASIRWDKGDIGIFCNFSLIHTSTPWERYKAEKRSFRLCFLNTQRELSN